MEKKEKNNRKVYITVLSVLASFAVVALHVNDFWNFRKDTAWVVANFVESLMYFAVPIFFMISGATLIDYRKRCTTKEYFIKRIKRTVIPFLVWSVLGAIFYYARGGEWTGVREFVSGILTCRFVGIYWFFPALFAVYLIIPLLSLIPNEKRQQAFRYIILAGCVINVLLPFAMRLLKLNYDEQFYFPVIGYTLYAVLGYYLDNYPPKRCIKVIYLAGIIGLVVHFLGTWVASYQAGEISMFYKEYLNWPCLLYSTAIFLWFKNLPEKNLSVLGRVAQPFSSLSYGIYLVQWFVYQTAWSLHLIPYGNVLLVWVWIIIVYLICASIIWCLKKIPILKEIV